MVRQLTAFHCSRVREHCEFPMEFFPLWKEEEKIYIRGAWMNLFWDIWRPIELQNIELTRSTIASPHHTDLRMKITVFSLQTFPQAQQAVWTKEGWENPLFEKAQQNYIVNKRFTLKSRAIPAMFLLAGLLGFSTLLVAPTQAIPPTYVSVNYTLICKGPFKFSASLIEVSSCLIFIFYSNSGRRY